MLVLALLGWTCNLNVSIGVHMACQLAMPLKIGYKIQCQVFLPHIYRRIIHAKAYDNTKKNSCKFWFLFNFNVSWYFDWL